MFSNPRALLVWLLMIGLPIAAVAEEQLEVIQESTPEQALRERAQAYWQARVAGDLATMYAMELGARPGGWLTPFEYQRIGGAGLGLREARITSVQVNGTEGLVQVTADVVLPRFPKSFPQTRPDHWVQVDGDWYHKTERPKAKAKTVKTKTLAEQSTLMQQTALPIKYNAIHVFAVDVDEDGRLDLGFTRRYGFTDILYQEKPRRFRVGPRMEDVGFHPGDFSPLPIPGKKYFVLGGEGSNMLRAFEYVTPEEPGQPGLKVLSDLSMPMPRHVTPFYWPEWGLSLAVSPFEGNAIALVLGYDPVAGSEKKRVLLGAGQVPGEVATADIDADGIVELFFTTRRTEEVWMVRFTGIDTKPRLTRLYKFKYGGARQVVPADVTGDERPELLVPQARAPKISVLGFVGKESIEQVGEIPFPGTSGISHLATARDRDGTRYVAAGGYLSLTVYRLPCHLGDFSDIESISLELVGWPKYQLLRDIDGDGWLDYVAAMKRHESAGMVVFGPLWRSIQELKTAEQALTAQPPEADAS